MPTIPTERLALSINRVEYILGAVDIRNLLRGHAPEDEIRGTIKETLRCVILDMDDPSTWTIAAGRMVRVTCLCWLLGEILNKPVRTEDLFPREAKLLTAPKKER